MYGTYYIKKKKKKLNKVKLLSSFIPIMFLLIIGGFVGNTLIKNTKEGNSANNTVANFIDENNSIQNNNETKNEENSSGILDGGKPQNNNSSSTDEESNSNSNGNYQDNSNTTSNINQANKPATFDSSVAFIGDSRTQGLILYNGLKKVQDYSYIGLAVDTAVTKKFIKNSDGEEITLLQDMQNKNIKTVYIMLGVNELGWSYPQVFKLKYKELIEEIRKVKPDCKIYVQSIIPMTKSKSDNDKIFNNKNVANFNQLIKEVAKEENVTYLDVQSALVDNQGYLPEEASTDGIHLDVEYCEKWLDYLKNNV